MENTIPQKEKESSQSFKPKTMRDKASDELLEKVNQLTDEKQIRIINDLLDIPFYDLNYLDATFFRDILKLDLNWLAINFCKEI